MTMSPRARDVVIISIHLTLAFVLMVSLVTFAFGKGCQ